MGKEQGQAEFLIGNHELMMIQSLFLGDKSKEQIWTVGTNGGKKTLEAFKKLSIQEQNKMKEFLLDSYVYKNIKVGLQDIHLVHAKSIQDKDDNFDKTVREMIAEGKNDLIEEAVWERDNGSSIIATPHPQSAKQGVFTIIGHSPTYTNMIECGDGFIDIDCGSAYEDNAALVNLTEGTVNYFDVKSEMKREKNNSKGRI